MISYIVSVYERMRNLNACLATLEPGEILVCLNYDPILEQCQQICSRYGAQVVATGALGAKDCYGSANMVAPVATGEWLCFPSDDSMYVARFSEIMLDTAKKTGADLVYCDCVYALGTEKNSWPAYAVLDSSPRMGRIDKTNFIVRREFFHGFPEHPQNYRDGALIEQLVAKGVRHAKASGVLVVHQ